MAIEFKTPSRKRVFLFVLFGLFVLLLYLYYFVGIVNIASVIEHTNLFYFGLTFVAFLISVLFFSLTWHSILNNLSIKVRIRSSFLFVWAGMFFDVVIPEPGWTGDFSRAYMMSKDSGQEAGKIVASIIGQKILVMAVTLGDFVLGFVLLTLNYKLPTEIIGFNIIVMVLSTFSLVIVCYLSAKPKATHEMLGWLIAVVFFLLRGRWNPADFRVKAERTLNDFHEGIQTLTTNVRALIRPIILSILAWGFDVAVIFLVFASLGYPVAVSKVLIVYALTGSLQSMGVSFLGITEVVMSTSYAVLGIPLAVSLSATLLIRVTTLWFKLALSYGAFQYVGVRLLQGQNLAK